MQYIKLWFISFLSLCCVSTGPLASLTHSKNHPNAETTTRLLNLKLRRQAKPSLNENNEDALKSLARDMGAAVRSKDAEKIMALYVRSDDLTVFDPGPEFSYRGWEAYRKEWKNFFISIMDMASAEFVLEQSRVSGNLGYFSGKWRMKFTNTTGEIVNLEGRMTEVVEKSGGKWRILHEHTSLPIPEENVTPHPLPKLEVEYFAPGMNGNGTSGVQGEARIGPTHGGPTRVGEIDTKPFANTLITIQREGGSLTMAQQRTDNRGHYRIALIPGKYLLVGLPPNGGARLPRGSSRLIEVREGKFTNVTVEYDSGMR